MTDFQKPVPGAAKLLKLRPMLRNSLPNGRIFEVSEQGSVAGTIDINATDREEAAVFLFDDCAAAGDRLGKGTHHTRVVANPAEISLAQFMATAETDVHPAGDSFSLDYSCVRDAGGVPAWGIPCSREAEEGGFEGDPAVAEYLHATLVAFSPSNEAVGFFRFSVDLTCYLDSTNIRIALPLVYVRPQFRHKTYGMDLAIATMWCLKEMYEGVCERYRRRSPLRVTIEADFHSKGGERISAYLAAELSSHRDMMLDMYPRLEGRLDEVVGDMGY